MGISEIGNAYGSYGSALQNNYSLKAADETDKTADGKAVQNATVEDSGILTGVDYLKNLERNMPGTAFFVGTVSYGQTYGTSGNVNFVVNPKYLDKLGTDADATKGFEEDVKYLANFSKQFAANEAANGWKVVSEGWFCDENGNWGGWTVVRKTDKKSFLENFSENAEKINKKKQEQKQEAKRKKEPDGQRKTEIKANHELGEKLGSRFKRFYMHDEKQVQSSAYDKNKVNDNLYDTMRYMTSNAKYKKTEDIYLSISGGEDTGSESTVKFSNTRDFMTYLSQNYDSVKNGIVRVSGSYLRECLKDESKQQELFEKLTEADEMVKDAEENIKGYQGMKITIDEDGNMESETYSGSVTFNEAKRARQLATATSSSDVQVVMGLLTKDLSDCQGGLASGMCDETEVQKVKAMIQKAAARMSEVSGAGNKEQKENGVDSFSINMLM